MHPRHTHIRTLLALIIALTVMPAPALAAKGGTKGGPGGGGGGSGKCNPRKTTCVVDATAPTIAIQSPREGDSVAGIVSVTGTSADDTAVAAVEVRVDNGAYEPASGIAPWSYDFDATSTAAGAHTITARATDQAGNRATTSITVHVTSGPSETGTALSNPAANDPLIPLSRTRLAVRGSVTAVLYRDGMTHQPWVAFRDTATGTTSHVQLPVPSIAMEQWTSAAAAWTTDEDLWIWSGSTVQYVRHYRLSGGSLPTSATLQSSRTFGDGDSRPGDFIALDSGALIGAWHQQGQSGPFGLWLAYRSPAGTWSTVGPLQFIGTRASKQVLAQHPADGSVWLFHNSDAWGALAAVHLTETATGLAVDWTDPLFISDDDGLNNVDPENPDLAAARDDGTGTIALAYQGADREIFSTSPIVTGSKPVVARIAADGTKSFVTMPAYVERVSSLGLVVAGDTTWLAYRPIRGDLTFTDLEVRAHTSGGWAAPTVLGTFHQPYTRVAASIGRGEFSTRLDDDRTHVLTP